jgi:FkbM family methyltransferase
MKFLRRFLYQKLGLEAYLSFVSAWYIRFVRLGFFKKTHPEIHYLSQMIQPGDVCIDIGANLGYYSLIMSELAGIDGKVYAVEPIPLFQKIWKKNVSKSKWKNLELMPFALGEKNQQIKMGMPAPDGIVHHGMTKVVTEDSPVFDTYFSAEMRIPDELFSHLDKLDFMKIDIEGYEFIALQHMKQIISKYKPKIQMEISRNREEIVQLMRELGYLPNILVMSHLIPAGKDDLKNHNRDFYFLQ